MTRTRVTWRGTNEVRQNITQYGNRIEQALVQLAQYWSPQLETYAKANARWQDQTANARQSLWAGYEAQTGNKVTLWISHGVEYGIWLEVANEGRYAILWETVEAHLPEIRRMLHGMFK